MASISPPLFSLRSGFVFLLPAASLACVHFQLVPFQVHESITSLHAGAASLISFYYTLIGARWFSFRWPISIGHYSLPQVGSHQISSVPASPGSSTCSAIRSLSAICDLHSHHHSLTTFYLLSACFVQLKQTSK